MSSYYGSHADANDGSRQPYESSASRPEQGYYPYPSSSSNSGGQGHGDSRGYSSQSQHQHSFYNTSVQQAGQNGLIARQQDPQTSYAYASTSQSHLPPSLGTGLHSAPPALPPNPYRQQSSGSHRPPLPSTPSSQVQSYSAYPGTGRSESEYSLRNAPPDLFSSSSYGRRRASPPSALPSDPSYLQPSWQNAGDSVSGHESERTYYRNSTNSGIISMYGAAGSTPNSPQSNYGNRADEWGASDASSGHKPTLPPGAAHPGGLPRSDSYSAFSQSTVGEGRPAYLNNSYSAPSVPGALTANTYSAGLDHSYPSSHERAQTVHAYTTSSARARKVSGNSFTRHSPSGEPVPLNAARGRSSTQTSTQSYTSYPADAFYTPSVTSSPDILSNPPPRHASLEHAAVAARQAVADAAGGEWRDRFDAANRQDFGTIDESRASSYFAQGQQLGRRPTGASIASLSAKPSIVTTPPVQSPAAVKKSASLASYASSQPTHPALRRPSARGTLSPNASLYASMGFDRTDSPASSTLWESTNGREYLNSALLSNIAVYVKDKVPKGSNVKKSIEYHESFTGEQLVSSILQVLPLTHAQDRRLALQIARSLQQSLWCHEVDWNDWPLNDNADGNALYMFDETRDEDGYAEIPTAVITKLTSCYSPFCGRFDESGYPMACYSYDCPNGVRNQLQRTASTRSATLAEPPEAPENWVSSVPASVAESVDKKERERQLVIFELIAGEQQYCNELDIIEKAFAEPLRQASPPVIDPYRLEAFLADVLLNISEIRRLNHALLESLLARQRLDHIVSGVGDLMLHAALDWGDAYLAMASSFPLADQILKEERADNPRFNEFLMDFHRYSKDTRIGFESFHKRASLRLGRYIMPLERIAKCTKEDDADLSYVMQALEVLREQATACNTGIKTSESPVQCRIYNRTLVQKLGDPLDLALLAPERRFFNAGKVYRRSEGSGFNDWSEAHLILFDHYLLTTKPARQEKSSGGARKYHITRRAIPLELLQIRSSSFTDPPVPRSSGFHLRSNKFASTSEDPSPQTAPNNAQEASSLVYPISLHKIGRNEGLITYYVESAAIRAEWEQHLTEALELRRKTQQSSQVVQLDVLSDTTFGARSYELGGTAGAVTDAQYGPPTCSAPLTTADGQSLVIAGCAAGLFIGFRGDKMRQVVHLQGITQCALLQEFGFVLVLAQGVLIAYPLEALIPSGRGEAVSKTPQKLSGKTQVLFFQVGKIGESADANARPLVIYVKKSGMKESVFKALEPVSTAERASGGTRFRFGASKGQDWFRTYKEFFLPSYVSSILFLRSKLAIVGGKGVEIMNLETLRTMTVPDFSHSRKDAVLDALTRRCDEAKTLGMFRLQDNLFLLAYDEFAFHVDKHGEPIPGRLGLIEWESKPEQVAYQAPYIYAFSSSMIEVRHAITGALSQVIPGASISLTYDGMGLDSGVLEVRTPSVASRVVDSAERRIHFSMRVGGYYGLFEIMPRSMVSPF